jgi:hypothetical protein
MRAAGGKVRRRLRSLEPGFLRQYFPGLANSAVVEAWQEQGPQQVFRISPLLTRFVALWSVLAFFAADFPVRAATTSSVGIAGIRLYSLNAFGVGGRGPSGRGYAS